MSLVLDASVALAWQFRRADEREADLAREILHRLPAGGVYVPAIWAGEVANVLLRGERAGMVSAEQNGNFLERLELSGIVFDAASAWAVLQRALSLARSHALTAYDASYLELALRLGAGLATFDRKLAVAARSVGVPVFGDAG